MTTKIFRSITFWAIIFVFLTASAFHLLKYAPVEVSMAIAGFYIGFLVCALIVWYLYTYRKHGSLGEGYCIVTIPPEATKAIVDLQRYMEFGSITDIIKAALSYYSTAIELVKNSGDEIFVRDKQGMEIKFDPVTLELGEIEENEN